MESNEQSSPSGGMSILPPGLDLSDPSGLRPDNTQVIVGGSDTPPDNADQSGDPNEPQQSFVDQPAPRLRTITRFPQLDAGNFGVMTRNLSDFPMSEETADPLPFFPQAVLNTLFEHETGINVVGAKLAQLLNELANPRGAFVQTVSEVNRLRQLLHDLTAYSRQALSDHEVILTNHSKALKQFDDGATALTEQVTTNFDVLANQIHLQNQRMEDIAPWAAQIDAHRAIMERFHSSTTQQMKTMSDVQQSNADRISTLELTRDEPPIVPVTDFEALQAQNRTLTNNGERLANENLALTSEVRELRQLLNQVVENVGSLNDWRRTQPTVPTETLHQGSVPATSQSENVGGLSLSKETTVLIQAFRPTFNGDPERWNAFVVKWEMYLSVLRDAGTAPGLRLQGMMFLNCLPNEESHRFLEALTTGTLDYHGIMKECVARYAVPMGPQHRAALDALTLPTQHFQCAAFILEWEKCVRLAEVTPLEARNIVLKLLPQSMLTKVLTGELQRSLPQGQDNLNLPADNYFTEPGNSKETLTAGGVIEFWRRDLELRETMKHHLANSKRNLQIGGNRSANRGGGGGRQPETPFPRASPSTGEFTPFPRQSRPRNRSQSRHQARSPSPGRAIAPRQPNHRPKAPNHETNLWCDFCKRATHSWADCYTRPRDSRPHRSPSPQRRESPARTRPHKKDTNRQSRSRSPRSPSPAPSSSSGRPPRRASPRHDRRGQTPPAPKRSNSNDSSHRHDPNRRNDTTRRSDSRPHQKGKKSN